MAPFHLKSLDPKFGTRPYTGVSNQQHYHLSRRLQASEAKAKGGPKSTFDPHHYLQGSGPKG
eukprot:6902142-Heterocapsa_arctica.AAC.1